MEDLPIELRELVIGDKRELEVKVIKPPTYVQDHPNGLPPHWKRKAFILNITEGETWTREGGERDTSYMINLFTQLVFEITEVQNDEKDKESIKRKLRKFTENCIRDQVDCIVVFVGSHGAKDVIQTSDDRFLEVHKDIIYPCQFEVREEIDGKSIEKQVVRIFLNSSCQVDLPEWLIVEEAETVVVKDSIYALAQIPKFTAGRDEYCGTYYAVVLTYVFMKKAWNTPVLELFLEVQKLLPKFTKCGGAIQLPPVIMGLNQPFYFFKNPYDFQFEVLQPVGLFTGRKTELSEIHQKFEEQDQVNLDAKKVAIVGLGGMGKTQIVRAFCQQFVGAVIWISAEKEQNIIESFRKVATERLNIPSRNADDKEKDITTIVEEVFNKFIAKPCLFVFDNVQNPGSLKNFMLFPNPNRNPPYILITSRNTEWECNAATLKIKEMSQQDSIEFVKKGLEIEQKDESQDGPILKLVEMLQSFPLALSIAFGFIKQQTLLHSDMHKNITNFLKKYESSPQFVFVGETNGDFNRYTESVSKILNVTTGFISTAECGTEAMILLEMISYFEPDNIPLSILSSKRIKDIMLALKALDNTVNVGNGSQVPRKNEDDYEAIKLLVKYAVINTQPEDETISIHRVVQEVTRIRLKKEEKERDALGYGLTILKNNLSLDLIRHAYSVFGHCKAYTFTVWAFKKVPLNMLGVLTENRKFHDVIDIGPNLKQILTNNEYVRQDDDNLIVRMDCLLAYANYQLGNYQVCHDAYKEILEQQLPQEHTKGLTVDEFITTMYHFALTYKALGQINECLELLYAVYEKRKQRYGQRSLETIPTLVEIAECLYTGPKTGKKDDRFPTQDKVAKLLKEFYEANIVSIASSSDWTNCMFSIANYFYKTNEMENARIIAEGVHNDGKNSTNSQVRHHAWQCRSILGNMARDKGNYEEALKIYQECGSEALGVNHKDVATNQVHMCVMLSYLGRKDEALKGFEAVVKRLQKDYPKDPNTVKAEKVMRLCENGKLTGVRKVDNGWWIFGKKCFAFVLVFICPALIAMFCISSQVYN